MFAEFIEMAQDGKKLPVTYINPVHIVKVSKDPATDPEKQLFVTQILDINGKITRVEGTPSNTRNRLQNPL